MHRPWRAWIALTCAHARPPRGLRTARGPLARWPPRSRARPRPPPRALLRAHAPARRARACSTSAAASSACARSSPSSTSPASTSLERPDYPGPFVRADAAAGLPFADGEFDLVYCSSVIEHVPPARRAAFAAEIRRVGRGWFVQTPAWSFPLEPHSLLPGGALAARALRRPTGASAPPAGGRRSRCCAARELEALFGPRSPSASGRSSRAGSACSPPAPSRALSSAARRLMSLLTPLITRNSSSTMPTELKRYIASERDPPPAHLLGDRPEDVPAVERQEREQVDDREDQREEAEEHERVAGAGDDRFVRDPAVMPTMLRELLAHLRARERVAEARERLRGRRATSRSATAPAAASTPNGLRRRAEAEADQHPPCLPCCSAGRPTSVSVAARRAGPSAAPAWPRGSRRVSAPGAAVGARSLLVAEATVAGRPSTATIRSPGRSTPSAGLPRSIARTEVVGTSVCTDGSRLPSAHRAVEAAREQDRPEQHERDQRCSPPGPARITTIRFHGACV